MHRLRYAIKLSKVLNVMIRSLTITMVVLLLAVAIALLSIHLRGDRLLSVQTGSMVPTLRPGDAVIVQPAPARNLHIGDIVSYQSPHDPSLIISHRVLRIDQKTGWLTTAGDATRNPDPTFPPRLVIGRITTVAPKLGLLLDTLRQPIGLVLIIYLPALAVIVAELRRLSSHYTHRHYRIFTY